MGHYAFGGGEIRVAAPKKIRLKKYGMFISRIYSPLAVPGFASGKWGLLRCYLKEGVFANWERGSWIFNP